MKGFSLRGPLFRVAFAFAIVAAVGTVAGCSGGGSGNNGVPVGSVFISSIDQRFANQTEVSILETQNAPIRLEFNNGNAGVQAKTFFLFDAAGQPTANPVFIVTANIGGQIFDDSSGIAPFLATGVNPQAGETVDVDFQIGFNGGNTMPYDATITVTVLPEIRIFDPLDPAQGDTADSLIGDDVLGAQVVFSFETEHDTVTINEVMARDNDAGVDAFDRPDFVEIRNGTSNTIVLDNYWLSAAGTNAQPTFLVQNDRNYFQVVTQPSAAAAGNIGGDDTAIFDIPGGNDDLQNPEFTARFPAGAFVASGGVVVVACDADDFFGAFAQDADFALRNVGRVAVQNMLGLPRVTDTGTFIAGGGVERLVSIDQQPHINDVGGNVVLFFLAHDNTTGSFADATGTFPIIANGIVRQPVEVDEPNVEDADILVYGVRTAGTNTLDPAIDKTGIVLELVGNAGTTVAFADDTANVGGFPQVGRNGQRSVAPVAGFAHAVNRSIQRVGKFEFVTFTQNTSEFFSNGNGLQQTTKFPGDANHIRLDPTTGVAIAGDERHVETSELLDVTFSTAGIRTPGQ